LQTPCCHEKKRLRPQKRVHPIRGDALRGRLALTVPAPHLELRLQRVELLALVGELRLLLLDDLGEHGHDIHRAEALIVAGSGQIDTARRLIAFFASPFAAEAIKKSGTEPVASAR